MLKFDSPIALCLRLGVFGTFLGHGMFAFMVNPKWIIYLTTVGFSQEQAIFLMPIIGIVDILVAFVVLIYPISVVVLYACVWAFLTASIRPIAGEPVWEFVERTSNWVVPLVLLLRMKQNK